VSYLTATRWPPALDAARQDGSGQRRAGISRRASGCAGRPTAGPLAPDVGINRVAAAGASPIVPG